MEKSELLENQEHRAVLTELLGDPGTSPYRYTKEMLLELKKLPCSNERPECLSEKYDSDGVWDPEKWHASLYMSSERASPVDGCKKEYAEERGQLKRRIADPRERLKDDDLDVVLSPQRRSFGGGCQGNAVASIQARRAVSPLDNKENEALRLGVQRRIGSGRIMAARGFERDMRGDKDLRERDRDFKDKRFRRDFGDKRVFSERKRNDSYAEEEPEWFSSGPTSQSETIELTGFDDKVLEDDKRRPKRSRKRSDSVKDAIECNGNLLEEPEQRREAIADQEVPRDEVPPEHTTGEFDFNEFFVPGLASMIEDVLGERPVSASRFSRWFTASPSGSRSSSLRSTPHEELERLAGLDPRSSSPSQGVTPYFTPIQSSEKREKVDILELLHKAKIDLKPLLSSLSANKERLRESTNSGVVLSLEEVEGGLKNLKVEESAEKKQPAGGTPFMAEHLEEALTGRASAGPRPRDADMSAFNKLVSTMKASGTLPTQPKSNQHPPERSVTLNEGQKNILQELLAPQGPSSAGSAPLLRNFFGAPEHARLLRERGASPPVFPQRASSPDFFPGRVHPPSGFGVASPHVLAEQFSELQRPLSPGPTPQQIRALSLGVDPASLEALALQQDLGLHSRQLYQQGFKVPQEKLYRNSRQPRMNRSPGPAGHRAGSSSPATVTSMLSPSFTPTSVIRKMYETKEKSRDEGGSRQESNDDVGRSQEDRSSSPSLFDGTDGHQSPAEGAKVDSSCSTPLPGTSRLSKDPERPQQGSSGHRTPTLVSPGPASPFNRPIYPMPLLPHMPLVRPPPPHLHPSVVQRMLAQGLQPQQLPPALLQAGMFPQGVDLGQVQGLSPALLGQPLYALGAGGHPLLSPRAAAPMQLAVLQQLQQQQRAAGSGVPQSHGPHRTAHGQQRRGSPPLGLAKWFGSDVLQQPLPSMPAKVISVDELEYRQ